MFQYFGVGSIPWSPLARGLLTRPLDEQSLRGDTDMYGCLYLSRMYRSNPFSYSFLQIYKYGSGTPDIIGRCVPSRGFSKLSLSCTIESRR